MSKSNEPSLYLYTKKKSWILVKKNIKKYNLQWNNWVQIIKMRKIQTANQNKPRVTHLSYQHLLSPRPTASLAPVGACGTRASFDQQKCTACHFVSGKSQASTCWTHSSHLSSTSSLNKLQHTIARSPCVESQIQHHHCMWSNR